MSNGREVLQEKLEGLLSEKEEIGAGQARTQVPSVQG